MRRYLPRCGGLVENCNSGSQVIDGPDQLVMIRIIGHERVIWHHLVKLTLNAYSGTCLNEVHAQRLAPEMEPKWLQSQPAFHASRRKTRTWSLIGDAL